MGDPDRYMSSDPLSASLTRIEIALMRVYGAFASWALELQKCVSGKQMSFQEIALLHCVRLRGGTTTLAEMMIFLHRHDLAAINYSLRKLEQYGLIKRLKTAYRREVAYSLTVAGFTTTSAYARIRQGSLVELCKDIVGFQISTKDASTVIERLIGVYDQATQYILNQRIMLDSTESGVVLAPAQDAPATKRIAHAPKSLARRR